MYGQDALSSWLVGKITMHGQYVINRKRKNNRCAGRYNKIEMVDTSRNSFNDDDEEEEGTEIGAKYSDNATV